MCGIVGYSGSRQALPILLDGLTKLEYRGYDSAGIAVRDGEKSVKIVKAKGKLKALAQKISDDGTIVGTTGVGHTRWATHGEPNEVNAHPHFSDDSNVVGVHNGIIENYLELRDKLIRNGYTFETETDTEVAIKLVDYYYKKYAHTPVDAINHAMVRIRGSYALALMFREYPGEVYAARKESPLIVGTGEGESFLASDVPAILKHTRNVYYIGNLEIGRLQHGNVIFYNLNGEEIHKDLVQIEWDAEVAEKGGYEHFLMKEIHEQPKAVLDTLHSVMKDDKIDFSGVDLTEEEIRKIRQIHIVACGSAYHVGVAAQYVIEDLARVPVRVELASEFRYRNPILSSDSLVIIISQSGETADSLAALRLAKECGVPTLGIVNVLGSTIAREADHVLYTLAGPEISVATTKAYSAQLVMCYAIAIQFAFIRGNIDNECYISLINEISSIPGKIEEILGDTEKIQKLASMLSVTQDIFFIGRGIGYAVSMEGSLKLKEISYIHSESYAAGELKHGSISLIEKGTPVIGVLCENKLCEKTISNLMECRSRGGHIVTVAMSKDSQVEKAADVILSVPDIDARFSASLTVIPLQILAYYVSVAKGLDVDKPRNLAKSVTVE